jgi:hypothetical protein
MSLPAESITHKATKMTVRLVLVKGKALRHAVPATYARTGVANLPSAIDLLQKWTDLRFEHALLFGLPEVEMTGIREVCLALAAQLACSDALSATRHVIDILLSVIWSSHGTDAVRPPCGGAQVSIWLGAGQR